MSSISENDLDAARVRANQLALSGDADSLAEAVEIYKSVISLCSGTQTGIMALYGLACALLSLAVEKRVSPRENLDRAIGYFDAFLELCDQGIAPADAQLPGLAKGYLGIALSYLPGDVAQNHARAMQCFDDAITFFRARGDTSRVAFFTKRKADAKRRRG